MSWFIPVSEQGWGAGGCENPTLEIRDGKRLVTQGGSVYLCTYVSVDCMFEMVHSSGVTRRNVSHPAIVSHIHIRTLLLEVYNKL